MTNKLTRNQMLVLAVLENEHTPLSAYTILDRLRDKGFRAPLQVYRALHKLVSEKLVHKLESVNAFMACLHPECHKHGLTVFIICEKCSHVAEVEDPTLAETILQMTQKEGFLPETTTIEIRGLCTNCNRKRA
ncbi:MULTISPECIES: Fur family transcriptional regulator [Bartonella]|uniref:Transcriptional regulator n=1 Tax=Bartonella choladocola TaxID=2750995 RepID=A0A1U9MK99_9HYPH|nr:MULTISPECIES: Fur family transcriptional regulator [Bartonella]AQT48158.1 transcriptional regulator [Bartonella choladocola]MBH9976210.1 transcriptional repressor [Bartonella choladocola]MBI0015926.1 transcriptional repressor [Bartonella sp. B10834G3]MBI0141444.1 transcriptional repressor [Bartonella choladocola]